MITIVELIKREGRWLGGQRPRTKYAIEWKPGTIFMKYPSCRDTFDWVKFSKAAQTKDERELRRIMGSPNELLANVIWNDKHSKFAVRFVGLKERFIRRKTK